MPVGDHGARMAALGRTGVMEALDHMGVMAVLATRHMEVREVAGGVMEAGEVAVVYLHAGMRGGTIDVRTTLTVLLGATAHGEVMEVTVVEEAWEGPMAATAVA